MSMLHTINKSPFERASLDTCLRVLQSGSTLLFYEDGVYAVVRGTAVATRVERALELAEVFCLEPDLAARGLDPDQLLAGVKLVGYEGFVELAVRNHQVQAWL